MSMALALRREDVEVPAWTLLAPTVAGSAAFGAAVGSYVGGAQVLYAAVKMPVFFLGTLMITGAALAVLASPRLSLAGAMRVALRSVFTTTAVLGALAPPILLVGLSLPKPEPRGYSAMIVVLTLAVAVSGTVSVVRLRRALSSTRLWLAWILLYGFTGAQTAWLLKPWVGHTLVADRFIPLTENLRGNFYEAAWSSLLNLVR